MKVYIAGRLGEKQERDLLEEIDSFCKELGFETYLPHRDTGLAKGIEDTERIFRKDILEAFKDCKLIIAVLDGLHVGSGTAWELGYAYAKGIPAIGIKKDESTAEGFEYLGPILIGAMPIVDSLDKLKKKIKEITNQRV